MCLFCVYLGSDFLKYARVSYILGYQKLSGKLFSYNVNKSI